MAGPFRRRPLAPAPANVPAQTPAGMWLALALISASLGGMCTALVGLYRLKAQYGPAPGLLLYGAYFLPTSINAAWLSVAAAVQLLVALRGGGAAAAPGELELPALAAAAAVTLAGETGSGREAAGWLAAGRRQAGEGGGGEPRFCAGAGARPRD